MKMYSSTIAVNGKPRRMVVVNHNESESETVTTETVKLESVHHIHVLDRSGSMSCDINDLIDGVQATVDLVADTDIITIIWFSGTGEHRTIIKGANKSEQIKKIVNSLRSTVGMTSFLGPLEEINTIIEEIGSLAQVSVNFFTDGNPQNSESEIMKRIAVISPKIVALNTIGYGNYYNQDLLRKMAAASNFGSFVHSTDLAGFAEIFSHNYEKISGVKAESLEVDTLGSADILYTTRKFSKLSGKKISLTKIDAQKNQIVMFGDDDNDFLFEYNGEKVNTSSISHAVRKDTIATSLYALASRLYDTDDREASLEILVELGDKPLIDSHFKSFSFSECAVHQELLNMAALSTKGRSPGSAPAGYVPADDAFCVIDLLKVLQETDSKYYPLSKNVDKYKRIGREVKDEYNIFEASQDEVESSFNSLTWNKEQLNLSILFSIQGKVKVNPISAKNVGLPEEIGANIWRTYTLIKDGALNISSIEVGMSEEAASKVLDKVSYKVLAAADGSNRYVLDLSSLPIINKAFLSKNVTITTVYDITKRVNDLEAKNKVVGYFIDKFEDTAAGAKVNGFASYTVDQIRVLTEHGISDKFCYAGVSKKVASTEESDFYEARLMKFTMAGFSSLPSVKEVEERASAGKPLNAAASALYGHLQVFSPLFTDTKKATLAKFLEAKKETTKELNMLRSTLAGIKLAKVLTGGWFSGIELDTNGKGYYQPAPDQAKMDVVSSYKKVYF